MHDDDLMTFPRRDRIRVGWIAFAMVVATLWGVSQFLQSTTQRRMVLASGVADGFAHELAHLSLVR